MNDEMLKQAVIRNKDLVKQPYLELIEGVGYDATNEFIERFGGDFLYIPTKAWIFGSCIGAELKKSYDGKNIRELAKMYDISQRTVKRLVNS